MTLAGLGFFAVTGILRPAEAVTLIPRGPETRYFAWIMGIRRNFVPRRGRFAPYFDGRLGLGNIDAIVVSICKIDGHLRSARWTARVSATRISAPRTREETLDGSASRVVKYPPRLNHALILNTDEASFHGFPEPLQCPEGLSRKSLALYYYTVDESAMMKTCSTNYRARPSDGYGKAAMIWLDKQAVDLYSRAKTRFGFSDRLASEILGLISRRR
jgi:hypothetical protein